MDSYDLTTYSATPGYFVLRMVIVLAIEAGVRPQQADVISAFQIPALDEKIAITMPKGFDIGGITLGICLKNMQGLK